MGNYCLKILNQSMPLQCWRAIKSASYSYELASDENVDFIIIDAEQAVIAASSVTISWVYKKSRRRSRWRLF